MTSTFGSGWFYWALAVAIGLPLVLVVLTEVVNALQRRGSAFAAPVRLMRNVLVPGIALLVLLVKASDVSVDATGVRILISVIGLVVLLIVLFGLRRTLFHGASEDSWRKRIPSIFLDVARFALIVVGIALIAAYVWGANIGGLFTALGVTSIVIGLALQNAAGQIISGLLLLFEQPFRLGDWLETHEGRGRVVEVNWRATHLQTDGGLQIMPNSALAESTFTNLSRPGDVRRIDVVTRFSRHDSPDAVCRVLNETARDLPELRDGALATTVMTGRGWYSTSIPVRTPGDDGSATDTFRRWAWYSARRAGLHFDKVDDAPSPSAVAAARDMVASSLGLAHGSGDLLVGASLLRYGAGETVERTGEVPRAIAFVVDGRVRRSVCTDDGAIVALPPVERGDFVGQSAVTRQPSDADVRAVTEVTVLQIPRSTIEDLTVADPRLMHRLGRAIEARRAQVGKAVVSEGGLEPPRPLIGH